MSNDCFERKPSILEETLNELIFGFEYAHPEQVKNSDQGKTAVEIAIEERKRQVRTMRSHQEPSRDRERKRKRKR